MKRNNSSKLLLAMIMGALFSVNSNGLRTPSEESSRYSVESGATSAASSIGVKTGARSLARDLNRHAAGEKGVHSAVIMSIIQYLPKDSLFFSEQIRDISRKIIEKYPIEREFNTQDAAALNGVISEEFKDYQRKMSAYQALEKSDINMKLKGQKNLALQFSATINGKVKEREIKLDFSDLTVESIEGGYQLHTSSRDNKHHVFFTMSRDSLFKRLGQLAEGLIALFNDIIANQDEVGYHDKKGGYFNFKFYEDLSKAVSAIVVVDKFANLYNKEYQDFASLFYYTFKITSRASSEPGEMKYTATPFQRIECEESSVLPIIPQTGIKLDDLAAVLKSKNNMAEITERREVQMAKRQYTIIANNEVIEEYCMVKNIVPTPAPNQNVIAPAPAQNGQGSGQSTAFGTAVAGGAIIYMPKTQQTEVDAKVSADRVNRPSYVQKQEKATCGCC